MNKKLSAFFASFLIAIGSTSAATLYWSGNGTSEGGNGNWDTNNPHFGTSSSGPFDQVWVNTNLDSVMLEVLGTNTIGPGTNIILNQLAASVTGINVSGGGKLTFTGPGAAVNLTAQNTTTFGCIFGGSTGSFTKTGPGRLEMNNASVTITNYNVTGGFLGTAALNRFGVLPATLVTNYFTLAGGGLGFEYSTNLANTRGVVLGTGGGYFGGSSTANRITNSAPITGTGALNIGGSVFFSPFASCQLYLLNTANNYTGGTAINASGNVVLLASGVIPDTGTVSGSGTLTLNNFNESIGSLSMSGKVVLGSGTLTLAAGISSCAGIISGAGSVVKAGTGTETLSGANTYTGPTFINAGVLIATSLNSVGGGASSLGNPGTVAAGTISLGSNTVAGTLRYNGSGGTIDRVINLAGTTGGGTIDVSGTSGLTLSSDLTATGLGNKTLTLAGTNSVENTFQGKIVDSSATNTTALTKTGASTWDLNAVNPYSGATTISAGTLKLNDPAAVSNSVSVTVATNATLDLNGKSGVAIHALAGRGSVINNSGGLLVYGDNTNGNSLFTYSGFSGNIDGSSSLTKSGTSAMSLRGTNTFSGPVYVNGGTLSVGAIPNSLPTGTALSIGNGGTFQLDANTQTVANLSGSGRLNLGSGTFIENTGGADVFTGTIRDSDLAGSSIANGNGLRGYYYDNVDLTSLVAVRDDATVNFSDFLAGQLPAGITDTNYFSVRWVGKVLAPVDGNYLFATRTDDGCRLWVNGELVIDSWASQSATVKTGTNFTPFVAGTKYDIVMEYLDLTGPATAALMWMPPNDISTNAIPSSYLFLPGAGSFVKDGSGSLTLLNTNTYSASTVVTNGTLYVQSDSGLGSGNVYVASGATLDLSAGIRNSYISSNAALVLNGGTVNLNFTGTNILRALSIDGGSTFLPAGNYTSTTAGLTGPGSLQVLGVSTTTTALASSGSTSVYGSPVTLTATVSVGATGLVTFYDGANLIGTSTLVGTTATLVVSNLMVATSPHSITATYVGDATHIGSTSSSVSQTTTPLTISPGVIAITTKTYDGANTATISFAGLFALNGVLAVDTNFVHLTNGVATFPDKNVGTNRTVTITGLTLAGSQSGNYTLSTDSATTTGTITPKSLAVTGITASNKPYDGTTAATINTAAAVSAAIVSGDDATLNTGSAVGTFNSATVGTGKTVAISGLFYTGVDSGNYVATATVSNVSITIASSSLALTSSANPSAAGASVTFTATASGVTTPTGNIIFLTNSVPFITNALVSGVATASTAAFLADSTNAIIVVYPGDANFTGQTNSLQQVVNPFIITSFSISITNSGTNAILSWTGAHTLQSTTNLATAWQDVAGATSPYTNALGGAIRFFQLKN